MRSHEGGLAGSDSAKGGDWSLVWDSPGGGGGGQVRLGRAGALIDQTNQPTNQCSRLS